MCPRAYISDARTRVQKESAIDPQDLRTGGQLEKLPQANDVLNDTMTAIFEMEEGVTTASEMRPWQRIIVAPSHEEPQNVNEPTSRLQLERAYGFTRTGVKDTVVYTASKDIAMAAGTMGVVMNTKEREQRFYMVNSV